MSNFLNYFNFFSAQTLTNARLALPSALPTLIASTTKAATRVNASTGLLGMALSAQVKIHHHHHDHRLMFYCKCSRLHI